MVMSMDAATDQAIGSPMEESAPSIRQQESVDEELNMDEQSKASGQTVVDAGKMRQQQQLVHPHQCQSTQIDKDQRENEIIKQEDLPAAMVLSRESSIGEGDERKLMMHVDYEASTSSDQKQEHNEQIGMKHKIENREDLDMKDPLVARMRDIVEGNQTTLTQCQHHQHQHHHHYQQQHQPKSSSGDSLNNQATENNSKASMDSTQQKRSRQNRHCGRHHHHHHHHHRPSLGTTNINIGQTASQTVHHHPHHHHRPVSHQHAHRHHHHHHHHLQHEHHHQTDSGIPQTSTDDTVGGKGASNQRPLGESDTSCKHQAGESSFSQTETSKQSKSSNSSVSSAPADQQQETIRSIKSNSGLLNQSSEAMVEKFDLKDGQERSMHQQTCHHHHHAHASSTSEQPHHHHHHHCHNRHHHHRNHKKRLVLVPVDDQAGQQVDNSQSIATANQEKNFDDDQTESLDKQQEMSSKDHTGPRTPLQEINSQTTNMPQVTGSCCPHHEHHCVNHQSRGTLVKLHPHHYHHHHHQLADPQIKKEGPTGEQQRRGHHYHHHHHHRHHHHGQHHSKPRSRRHKSSSNTNINEQTQNEHGHDFASSNGDKQHQVDDESTQEGVNASRGFNVCDNQDSNSSERDLVDLENKMHLDNNDESSHLGQPNHASSMDKASSEVVNMEISPNSDNKQIKRPGLIKEPGDLVETAIKDSNFIAAIEVSDSKATKSSTNDQNSSSSNEKRKDQQQVDASDYNTQGASGSDATKNNSAHEFTRNQEGDSMKKSADKNDRLIGQMSRENSRKGMFSGTGAGAGKQQNQQQLIECSPVQQSTFQQQSQPKQIIESTVSPDRRCKLCWCCCCPCSGLSSRNNQTKAEVKQNVVEAASATTNKCQSFTNIPLEKVRVWGESFDRLMKCPDGRRVFQDFLRCEYSEENILFWLACEELKNEKDGTNIYGKAREIYEDYISILSAKEVSLDSRVRDVINREIDNPTSKIFDEAQVQIYTLMHRDSYPRFINSPMYKKLAQIQTSSSRKGSAG